MSYRLPVSMLFAALPFVSFASSAAAIPIPVTNFNFEANALADGGIAVGTPTGWVVSGGTQGTFNPNTGFYNNPQITDPPNSGVIGTMSGPRAGFIFQSPGQTMTNTTSYNVVVGETYQLTVAIGNRTGAEVFGGSTVTLLDGDSVLATLAVPVPPAVGTFGDVTLNYISLAGDAGALRIRLGQVNNQYSDFDNVRLERFAAAAAIPEPASLSLLVLGGMALLRRRRTA